MKAGRGDLGPSSLYPQGCNGVVQHFLTMCASSDEDTTVETCCSHWLVMISLISSATLYAGDFDVCWSTKEVH